VSSSPAPPTRTSSTASTSARHAGASGLGLAIVRAIVVAHGGDVSLVSAPGVGTTVRVELPR